MTKSTVLCTVSALCVVMPSLVFAQGDASRPAEDRSGSALLQQREPLVVAAVSCVSRLRQKEANLDRIEHWARRAAEAGVHIALFPECGISAWWQSRENRVTGEAIDGPSIGRLTKLAQELDIVLAVGLTELDGNRSYISHVLLGKEGVIGVHRKSALAGGKNGEESAWDCGNDANVFEVRGYQLGVAICFESVHPETCAALRKNGAEIILAPYANGTRPEEITDLNRRQRRWIWDRVAENRLWYIACDATPAAKDGAWSAGAAYAINPEGKLAAVSSADAPGEQMIVVTIRPETIKAAPPPKPNADGSP